MPRLLPLAVLLFVAAPAPAVLDAPIKLGDIIGKLPFIFAAEVDAVDADKGTAVFLPADDLKGKCPFPRLPVNLKDGVTEAGRKAEHTKVILERLAKGRKLVLFVSKASPDYSAWGFVEGTWFQLAGTADKDDKEKVRWALLNCEPALRGTFKGTTAELQALVADVVAGKVKAPAPDKKREARLRPDGGGGEEGEGERWGGERGTGAAGFTPADRELADGRGKPGRSFLRPPVRRHPGHRVRRPARGAGRASSRPPSAGWPAGCSGGGRT